MIGSISMLGGSAWGQTGQVGLSAMRQQRTERMFKEMDADGSGSVSKDEFVGWDKQMRARMPQAGAGDMPSAEDIFAQLDSDGDGELSQAELAAMGEKMRALREAQMFNEVDTDGDGSISKAELAAWREKMQATMPRMDDAEGLPSVDDAFAEADSDGDGVLSSTEFSALGKALGGPPPGPPPGLPPTGGGEEVAGVLSDLLDALNESSNSSSSKARSVLDTNGDGKVSLEELIAGLKGYADSLEQSSTAGQSSSLNLVA